MTKVTKNLKKKKKKQNKTNKQSNKKKIIKWKPVKQNKNDVLYNIYKEKQSLKLRLHKISPIKSQIKKRGFNFLYNNMRIELAILSHWCEMAHLPPCTFARPRKTTH